MAKTHNTKKNYEEIVKRPIAVNYLKKYLLELVFEDEKRTIDLYELFVKKPPHSFFKRYASEEKFKTVRIDRRGALCWGDNELDLNPNTILQYEVLS